LQYIAKWAPFNTECWQDANTLNLADQRPRETAFELTSTLPTEKYRWPILVGLAFTITKSLSFLEFSGNFCNFLACFGVYKYRKGILGRSTETAL